MTVEFHKMHGAGNDFVLLDLRRQAFEIGPDRARAIADRRLGVGCDQILVLREADDAAGIARYEVWNADGSTAGQCGNGARCIGLYLKMNGEAADKPFGLQSPSGMTRLVASADGEFEVDMGAPDFAPERVPVELPPVDGWYELSSERGPVRFGAVSMGNPHALVVVDDIENAAVEDLGRFISTHQYFPRGCNAGFAQIVDRGTIRLRVYERGSGETPACGSGACAAVAILRRAGRVGSEVDVFLPGGHLVIKWAEPGGHVSMKGPAVHVFRGTLYE